MYSYIDVIKYARRVHSSLFTRNSTLETHKERFKAQTSKFYNIESVVKTKLTAYKDTNSTHIYRISFAVDIMESNHSSPNSMHEFVEWVKNCMYF